MKYAIIKNNICTNVVVANDDYANKLNAVPLDNGFGIGDRYENGLWSREKMLDVVSVEERIAALEEALLSIMEVQNYE